MKNILFAAVASVALSVTPALATQVGQGGHRVAAGYDHVLQADAGGGNGGAAVRYAEEGGGNGGTAPRYAEEGGGNGGAASIAEAGDGNRGRFPLYAEAGGGDGGRQPQLA